MKALKTLFKFFFILSYFLIFATIIYSEIKQAHWYSIQILFYAFYFFQSFNFLLDGCKGQGINIKGKEVSRLDSKTRGMHFPFFWRIVWASVPAIMFIIIKINVDFFASIDWNKTGVTDADLGNMVKQVAINVGLLYVAIRYLDSFVAKCFKFGRRVCIRHDNFISLAANGHHGLGETIKIYKADTNTEEKYTLPTEQEIEAEIQKDEERRERSRANLYASLHMQQQYNMEKENRKHAEEQARRDYERNRILEKQAREQEEHNRKMRKHAEEMERLARRKA